MARASTSAVTISGFAFGPSSLSITTGTAVRWTNADFATHTTTSDSVAWDSGGLSNGASFEIAFIAAGTYAYHCSVHPSMHGTIVVTGPPLTPPPPADVMAAPGNLPGTIVVSWSAPNVVGVSGYTIYRGTTSGSETFLTSTPGTARSSTDSGLAPLQSYYYQVASSNGALLSTRSIEACAKPFPWLAALGCASPV